MEEKSLSYLDLSGGTAMHRERDARLEPRRFVPDDVRTIVYDEALLIPRALLCRVDLERLKTEGWVPLSMQDGTARVAAIAPEDPAVGENIRRTLDAEQIEFVRISPEDLAKTIYNNEDVNPGFPSSANRTTLAKVRTYLANRRSLLVSRRTVFAKGRTGLAMFRTGLAFVTAVLLLIRVFGLGWTSFIELALLCAGVFLMIEGFLWYLPARRLSGRRLTRGLPDPGRGVTVLGVKLVDMLPVFERSAPVAGAEAMRSSWDTLTPVMRRRFLALDRTNLAEERTLLAYFRTLMAKSRTGMALGRTGVALAGIGSALARQFHQGQWDYLALSLIAVGVIMTLEGLYWYFPGRRAGRESIAAIRGAECRDTAWSLVLPHKPENAENNVRPEPLSGGKPGIWGSTGLALERTLLAERRNVMARLRTHLARSRTGLSFIRTGMNFTAVGLGLLASFGTANPYWTILETFVLVLGVLLVADGLYWYIPSDRMRKRLPYCSADMDIALPDYATPVCEWPKAVFSDAD
ncbi:DUF202 domain-containing protein [Desulfomicrobium salsuginis]